MFTMVFSFQGEYDLITHDISPIATNLKNKAIKNDILRMQ